MITTHEVNDIRELAGYRLAWNSLLQQTRNPSFFLTLDWLEVYWRHFEAGQRLRVIVVCDDDKPFGILPLVVRSEANRLGRLRVLTYPLDNWGTFYGPIGPAPSATLLAAMKHIRQTRRDWDLIDLRWVDLDESDFGRTRNALRLAGYRPWQQAWDQGAVIDMQGTWEEYWQSRDKKWRHDVDRVTRRLAGRGEMKLVRYRPEGAAHGDGDPRDDLFDDCLAIARASWQGTVTDGTTLCHPEVSDYLRDVHATAARIGMLDVNILTLDGRPLAFNYNYHYDGRVYGLRKGFDPEFSSLRPGTVLQRMLVEDSFARGDSQFDLGVTSLDTKRHWQTRLVTSYRYSHFPWNAPRAQLLGLKRWFDARRQGTAVAGCA